MSDRLLVATRKGVFQIRRAPDATWSVARVDFLGVNTSLVSVDPRDGAIYAALGHGHFGVKLHRSRDEGRSWVEIAAPRYPPKPEGLVDTNPASGKEIEWSTHLIWELVAGGADSPGELWCGTIPGGLFHSCDHGASWEIVGSLWNHEARKRWFGGGYDLPGIHSICVDPSDSARLFLGVSCGGVWLTCDRGKSWELRAEGMRATYMPPELANDPGIQDPHRLVQCTADPRRLWVQHHNGIFVTRDAARTWTEIVAVAPATFGFAVAVHPKDPDTAWVVPAQKDEVRVPVDGKVLVNRTRDGGKTWQALRKGLPQQHAYDLVLRHALAVDETGMRLAFGSTCGNLWISEDQGDSWRRLDANLPPIHSVLFG